MDTLLLLKQWRLSMAWLALKARSVSRDCTNARMFESCWQHQLTELKIFYQHNRIHVHAQAIAADYAHCHGITMYNYCSSYTTLPGLIFYTLSASICIPFEKNWPGLKTQKRQALSQTSRNQSARTVHKFVFNVPFTQILCARKRS